MSRGRDYLDFLKDVLDAMEEAESFIKGIVFQ